jgi:multimeric flavodoxin WrbA
MAKENSDENLLKSMKLDKETLSKFEKVRKLTIEEAKKLGARENKDIKVLGVSGSARDELDMAQEKSNSEELLMICLDECRRLGADTELIKLRKYDIKHCKACYSTTNTQCHFYCSCYPKGTPAADDMSNVLYDKILEADVIIFASPVNNFKISTLMSAFVDRCISLDGSLKPADPNATKDKELNTKHMKFIELTADNEIPGSGMLRRFSGKVAGIIITGHEEGAAMAISSMFMTLNHFGMIFPPFSTMYAMSSYCNSTYKDKEILLSDCYKNEAEMLAANLVKAAKVTKNCKHSDWKYDCRAN